MMRKIFLLMIICISLSMSLSAQTYTFDFSNGYEGWSGNFAEYPITDSLFYELEFVRTSLPEPLDTNQYALMISGNNHSDDLFMYIKRKISGLIPNTTYKLLIDVDFASNAPTNAYGVGGPPGEAVTMKAGATIEEPRKYESEGYYHINLDKGNQSMGGADMETIGHVGVSDTTTVFTLINRNNADRPFTITSDNNGELWVCIGTDSGFEATTRLYYNQISLEFTNTSDGRDDNQTENISVFPNPADDILNVKISPQLIGQNFEVISHSGKQVISGKLYSEISSIYISQLSPGAYFIRIAENPRVFKFIKE